MLNDTRDAPNWWTRPKRIIRTEVLPGDPPEPICFAETEPAFGALRIVQGCHYDPGSAVFRFHSAVNETTPHASLWFVWGENNPFTKTLRQLDMFAARETTLRWALLEADVVHCHMDYRMLELAKVGRRKPGTTQWDGALVHHYHGSILPSDAQWKGQPPKIVELDGGQHDHAFGAIRCGARLSLLDEAPDMEWLPITVPVHRYHVLRQRARTSVYLEGRPGIDRPFRIGHSPTDRTIKGSDVFDAVVAELQASGFNVVPVLIEKMPHADALTLKASCDAVFDSFWLGLQTSGLEAGAMSIPVIAGDPRARELHEEHIGYCPWLYANNAAELRQQILDLIEDDEHRYDAGCDIRDYVWQYHSYDAVSQIYLDILERRAPHLATRIQASRLVPPDRTPAEEVHERPAKVWHPDTQRWVRAPRQRPVAPKPRIHTPARGPMVTT